MDRGDHPGQLRIYPSPTGANRGGDQQRQDEGIHDIQQAFQSWDSFTDLLGKLGYAPASSCPWRALGLDPATTTTSAEALINDRAQRLRLLLGEASIRAAEGPANQTRIADALRQVDDWQNTCLQEMPDLHGAARKRGYKSLQIRYEPPPGLEKAIHAVLRHTNGDQQRKWHSALWNTDVRGTLESNQDESTLGTREANDLTTELLKSGDRARAALAGLPGLSLITWMPREPDQGARLLTHLQQVLTQDDPDRQFLLVCERAPSPPSCQPDMVMDYWKSPLRQDKWRHLVQEITHLREPEYLTITTEGQIQQALRSFTLVRVGSKQPGRQPLQQITWKKIIHGPEDAHVIQVEIPQTGHMAARRALHAASATYNFTWDGPWRSPASRGKHRRLLFAAYLPRAIHSELGAYILCGRLKKFGDLAQANIAPEELSNNRTARIADATGMAALQPVADLITAALVMSPTEALIDTSATQQEWEQRLTELAAVGGQDSIRAIRWRHERGGATWARPRTLPPIAIRRRGKHHPGRLFITLQGSMGPTPRNLLRQMMAKIQEATGHKLQEKPTTEDLNTGQWRMDSDPGDEPTGQLEILLSGQDQAERMQDILTNAAIQTQQRVIPIQITGDALTAGTFRRT